MKDLKERTVRGGIAKVTSQAASFVLRLGSLMVMARLLAPEEFGLVAMVGAVTGVFNLFKDAGLSMATVQRPSITDDQISTLFWINLLVGGILAIASIALAPVLVAFYREPRLFWITIAFGGGFVLNALGVQHSAILQRHMRFSALAVVETVALVLSTAAGIGMAWMGFGYWSLVAMAVAQPAVASAGAWLLAGWVPSRPRRGVGIGSMVSFGGTISINVLIVYVAYNLDKVLLGRLWGADVLGIYGRAYQLVNIPIENFNSAVGGVAFSALSRLQDSPVRLRSYFLKGYTVMLVVTIPVTAACFVLAPEIVHVALGPKWNAAAPLLTLLSPTILVLSLINPLGWLMFSSNLVWRSLKIALVIAPCVIVAYLLGLPQGARGVALGFSAMMLVLAVPVCVWAVRGTPVAPRDLLGVAARPLLSGIAAVLACLVARQAVGETVPPLARLVLGGVLLLAVYAWVLLRVLGQGPFYLDLIRQVLRRSPPVEAE
jgi:PST family polysaccharide transporter